MANKPGAQPQRIYEDFEPRCKCQKPDTVKIYLPAGFKKEHLTVQTNPRILTIHGERPLNLTNKWSRFHKEIKLADKNCDLNEVRADVERGILTVTMPQKVSTQISDYNNNNNAKYGTSTGLLSRSKLVGKDVALKLGVAVAVVVAFGFGANVIKYYKHGGYHPCSSSLRHAPLNL